MSLLRDDQQYYGTWFKRQTDSIAVITDDTDAGEHISPVDLVGKITAIGDLVKIR